MKKDLIIYYSWTGNNEYVAKKLKGAIDADIEQIETVKKLGMFFDLVAAILFGSKARIKPIKSDVSKYNLVVVLGPVWGGRISSPVRTFLTKYSDKIKNVAMLSVRGGAEENSADKALDEFEQIVGKKVKFSKFLPLSSMLSGEDKNDMTKTSKVRLSDDNFSGEIKKRFDEFVNNII